MSECTHDCSSCSESCSDRTQSQTDFMEPLYKDSSVKKVIGVVSGKGGVGKSLTTALLAVAANRKGLHTGILLSLIHICKPALFFINRIPIEPYW